MAMILPALVFTLMSIPASATHINGADLSYRWLNGTTIELSLCLYRDCAGISAPNNLQVNCSSATGGHNFNTTLFQKAGTGLEITRPCNSSPTNCSGGTSPGVQKYEYSGTVTLPEKCPDWIFGYSNCCRNCAITTISFSPPNCAGAPATYVEATLNNVIAPDNSSPVFSNLPMTFLCIGETLHYNSGAYDPDGDSLVYESIIPRSEAGTNVNYTGAYSAGNPITSSPAFSLSQNGDMMLHPTAMEVGVMALRVNEYRNGRMIGSTVRDMQVYTISCSNALPTASGVNGSNEHSITACPGQAIHFTINSDDTDNNQLVTMEWDYGISGARFSTNSAIHPTGTFDWIPGLNDARMQPYTFTVSVIDNNCPNSGIQTYSYRVLVAPLAVNTSTINATCAGSATGTSTAMVLGTAPFRYSWFPGGATTSAVTGLHAGNYTVTVTDSNGCTVTQSSHVDEPDPLQLNFSHISAICIGQSVMLSAQVLGGLEPYTYHWNNGQQGPTQIVSPSQSSNYGLTVYDANGCKSRPDSISVLVRPQLQALVTGPDSICAGDAVHLSITASGGDGGPYTYQWSDGSTTPSVEVWPQTNTNYSVTVNDDCGTPPATAVFTINVNSNPDAGFLPDAVSACPPLLVAFSNSQSGISGLKHTWNLGDGTLSEEENPQHIYKLPGAYTVSHIVKNSNQCVSQVTIPGLIKVLSAPVSDFVSSPEVTSIHSPTIAFTNNSRNSIKQVWYFGDGLASSSLPNPEYNYRDTGTYSVRLISESSDGCFDTAYGTIRIKDEFAIYIPNAFTPNGDGVNESFAPLAIGTNDFEMSIYNRWGQLVFHSVDLKIGWDGKRMGSDLPCESDVYVYTIFLRDNEGHEHTQHGRVHLLR